MSEKDDLPWRKIYECRGEYKHGHNTIFYTKESPCVKDITPGYFIRELEAIELWEMKEDYEPLSKDHHARIEKLQRLEQENTRLRKTLEIFAKRSNWYETCPWNDKDNPPWLIAQEALKK
jgi:hypothetical protein